MKKIPISHGDINFHPISKAVGKVIKSGNSYVVAKGDTTGHEHVITCSKMEVRKMSNGLHCFVLKTDATITHNEHPQLTIPKGIYKEVRELEHDWFSNATRRVID